MFLLDTCTLLWLAGGAQDRLSTNAADLIRRHPSGLFVSAISAFEIGVKAKKGKLQLRLDPRTWFDKAMTAHGLHGIPVTSAIAAASTMLPPRHVDPCDRMIIATAMEHGFSVLTPDDMIGGYPDVTTTW